MAASGAFATRKGGDGRAGVDYSGLALCWVAYPDVDVMGSVALVEGAQLLFREAPAEIVIIVSIRV